TDVTAPVQVRDMTIQFFGCPDIVRIEESNNSGASLCNTAIACTRYPMILLMKDTGAPIRQALAYFNTIIVAAVVNDQQLKVGKTLHQHRLHCRANETFSIINMHNETDTQRTNLTNIYAF